MNPSPRDRPKVVLIGLDAFDPGILLRMTEEGHLPTLGVKLENCDGEVVEALVARAPA